MIVILALYTVGSNFSLLSLSLSLYLFFRCFGWFLCIVSSLVVVDFHQQNAKREKTVDQGGERSSREKKPTTATINDNDEQRMKKNLRFS